MMIMMIKMSIMVIFLMIQSCNAFSKPLHNHEGQDDNSDKSWWQLFTQAVEGAGEPLDESLVSRLRSAIRSQLSVGPDEDDDEDDDDDDDDDDNDNVNTAIITTILIAIVSTKEMMMTI